MKLHTVDGELTPVAPFDFNRSLKFLGEFKPISGEQSVTDTGLIKAVRENGHNVAFRLQSTGTIEQPSLAYTLFSPERLDGATRQAVLNRISFFLSLDEDLKPFYRLGEQDPHFAPIIKELYGYHQVKFLTPFEVACWAILSQRNLMTVAQKMKQTLTGHFKNGVEIDGHCYLAFPDAEQVATLSAGQLNDLIRNERKAETLSGVAAAFTHADENFLRTAPYAEAEKWLRAIKGIGEWSASFILLRGLGRMEWVPVGEVKLQEAAGQIYRPGQPLDLEDLKNLGQPYGQWQGYWAHYLRVAS